MLNEKYDVDQDPLCQYHQRSRVRNRQETIRQGAFIPLHIPCLTIQLSLCFWGRCWSQLGNIRYCRSSSSFRQIHNSLIYSQTSDTGTRKTGIHQIRWIRSIVGGMSHGLDEREGWIDVSKSRGRSGQAGSARCGIGWFGQSAPSCNQSMLPRASRLLRLSFSDALKLIETDPCWLWISQERLPGRVQLI